MRIFERTGDDSRMRASATLSIVPSIPREVREMLVMAISPAMGLGHGPRSREIEYPGYQRLFNSNWVGPWVWEAGEERLVVSSLLVFHPDGHRVWQLDFSEVCTVSAPLTVSGPLIHLG